MNKVNHLDRTRFCQIWCNLKRFPAICSVFSEVCPRKNKKKKKRKKWITRSLISLDFVPFEEICIRLFSFFQIYVQEKTKKLKNEKSGSRALVRQILFNLKRFQLIIHFFPDVCLAKNKNEKKVENMELESPV